MTEEQLTDLEECSQMFDFSGFTPEEDRQLLAEVRRLQKELVEACKERDLRRSRQVLCTQLQERRDGVLNAAQFACASWERVPFNFRDMEAAIATLRTWVSEEKS